MDPAIVRCLRDVSVTAGICCSLLSLLSACDGNDGLVADLPAAPDPIVKSKFDGTSPDGLVLGRDGNLYGTTFFGGDFGFGTVFRILPDGTQTVLHSFAGGSDDGANPQGLMQASDGNFYGTTSGGIQACPRSYVAVVEPPGAQTDHSGCGTVFKLTPRGEETVLYFFHGGADGKQPIPGVVEIGKGNFYGATTYGGITSTGCGTEGCGVVFRITAAGEEATLYSFDVSAGDGRLPAGLTLGRDGNLYGTTQVGGETNQGTVFKVTGGGVETVLHQFRDGATDGQYPNGPLVQASDGNFYGTTRYGGDVGGGPSFDFCGFGCGALFRITPTGVETLLYSFNDPANGLLPLGALIVGSDGNLYGTTGYGGNCQPGCGTVFKSTLSGNESVVYRFGPASVQIPLTPAFPSNLVRGSHANVYGTAGGGEFGEGVVFRISPDGEETILHSFRGRTNQ
jgi:uncharacterized repeat protein (TIGR03803 family)